MNVKYFSTLCFVGLFLRLLRVFGMYLFLIALALMRWAARICLHCCYRWEL